MRAIYDLEVWQPSYTYVIFLMGAEHERIKRGAEHIDIEVMPGTHSDGFGWYKHWPSTVHGKKARVVKGYTDDRQQCLDQIVMPMGPMLRSCRSNTLLTERKEYGDAYVHPNAFSMEPWVAAYAAGIRPLSYFRDKQAFDPKLVTITLREAGFGHWPQRDSNINEWIRTGVILRGEGYKVVVVRDTRKAAAYLPYLDTHISAAIDLQARAELYQRAAMNLMVSNGPTIFAQALDVPVMMFRPTCENGPRNAKLVSMEGFGFKYGEQLPGTPPHQRIVWTDDRTEEVVPAFREFMKELYG